ncbi:MAG: ATP-binding protein [Pleomorphochaeta sp.]
MVDKELLKQILIENIELVKSIDYYKRNVTLEDNMPYVFVGLRRVGKSYLLYQRIHELIEEGKQWDSILLINFEDERLLNFKVDDFNNLIEAHYQLYNKKPILFLDEIQIVDGWEKFARRMVDSKYQLYITGSNAKMLSKEIATTLGGRFLIHEVFPYNFDEFLKAKKITYNSTDIYSTEKKAIIINQFNEYLNYGGLPEIVNIKAKRNYLNNIFQKIYLGDIALRNDINNIYALKYIPSKIAETIRSSLSFTRLTNLIKSLEVKVGKATIIQYIEMLKDSFLLFTINNIDSKFSEKIKNPKYYFYDTGLLNLFLINQTPALLENLVAIYLIQNCENESIFFFNNNSYEIDFYIPEKNIAIQVCYSLSSEETKKRETKALIDFSKFKNCNKLFIITHDEEAEIVMEDKIIKVIPIWKILLNYSSLVQ